MTDCRSLVLIMIVLSYVSRMVGMIKVIAVVMTWCWRWSSGWLFGAAMVGCCC